MTETERAIHPAAAVFPRLAEDELRDLADDIRANGLHHAIVLDSEGRIVDGINRDIACGMAGVEKRYMTLPADTDVEAYILSENIRRRHMSKGQQAVAIAMMIETGEGKRDGQTKQLISNLEITHSRVSEALLIRRYAAELTPGILAGTEKFDAALLAAKARKREQDDKTEARERQAREEAIEVERIRRIDPALAEMIPDRLTVDEAKATLVQRLQRDRDRKESTTRLAESAFSFLDPGLAATPGERAAQIIATLDASVIPARPDLSSARGYRCAATLQVLCELLRQREEDQHGRRS